MMIQRDKLIWAVLMLILAAAWPSQALHAQESFFKGKQIRIVVGLSTGGGYERAARLVSRYMGRYLPGNPDFAVQNMPGAGSVTPPIMSGEWPNRTD